MQDCRRSGEHELAGLAWKTEPHERREGGEHQSDERCPAPRPGSHGPERRDELRRQRDDVRGHLRERVLRSARGRHGRWISGMVHPLPVQWHELHAPPVEAGGWEPDWSAVIISCVALALRMPMWAGPANPEPDL